VRRHVVSPPPETPDFPAEPVSRGNLRQQVTARITTAIFQGRFRSGQRLVVQTLARAYQASPTPVREAMVELASLGLVELLPNRGAVVQPFGRQEIREISAVRRLLEVEAARCACGLIADDELASLEQELVQLGALPHDQVWDQRARDLDNRLHGLIAASCGSRRLAAEIGRYLTLFRALRDVSHQRDAWTNFSRSNDVPDHLAIVTALRASDPERAAAAMDRHIRSAAQTLEEIVFSTSDITDPGQAAEGGPEPPQVTSS
jgi:DNA-binding GntR family transcriptional regulator